MPRKREMYNSRLRDVLATVNNNLQRAAAAAAAALSCCASVNGGRRRARGGRDSSVDDDHRPTDRPTDRVPHRVARSNDCLASDANRDRTFAPSYICPIPRKSPRTSASRVRNKKNTLLFICECLCVSICVCVGAAVSAV